MKILKNKFKCNINFNFKFKKKKKNINNILIYKLIFKNYNNNYNIGRIY